MVNLNGSSGNSVARLHDDDSFEFVGNARVTDGSFQVAGNSIFVGTGLGHQTIGEGFCVTYGDAANGGVMYGHGSTNDVLLRNQSGVNVAWIPALTNQFVHAGVVTFANLAGAGTRPVSVNAAGELVVS